MVGMVMNGTGLISYGIRGRIMLNVSLGLS